MELREGQVIANYALVRKLGGGAFGEVWLVRHTELGVERAMKIPTDAQYVKQLRAEGKIQFSLSHPNIVQTLDLNTQHSPPYFLMEYVEGMNLRQHLLARGKLPVDEAMGILAQVLNALAAAHAQEVIHRDIKPENVLITSRGQVKVTDFGLGKVQAEVERSLLLSGSLMSKEGKSISGTLQYMSPGQQAGAEPDAKDDLYSLGVLACELLTGTRPSGLGIPKMFQRAGVDGRAAALVEKALEEPAYRYQSAGEMAAAVAGLLEAMDTDMRRAREEEARRKAAEEQQAQRQREEAAQREAEELRQRVAWEAQRQAAPPPVPVRPRKSKAGWWALGLCIVGVVVLLVVCAAQPDPPIGLADPPRVSDATVAIQPLNLPGGRQGLSLDLGGGVTMKMAQVPAGTFTMGSPANEENRGNDETQHRVTISRPFYMGVTTVTQAQWKAVMGTDPSNFKGDNLPVEQVSWDDAMEFCKKLSARVGKAVRLPTEAQWEYACRAGSAGPYAGTGKLDEMGWYCGNSGGQTHPVATKQPNAWGLCDMHGNVWQWCSDWYGPYPSGAVTDPVAAAGGASRVIRGGSWSNAPLYCRAARRGYDRPLIRVNSIGYRCALDFP